MPRTFTDKQAKSLLKARVPGRHAAGNGLYFRISKEGSGSWEVRYVIRGKRRQMTLGAYPELSLVEANSKTAIFKLNIKKGIDPLAERARLDKVEFKTVSDLAADWIKDCERRLKYPNIPRRAYERDIAPYIGDMAIEQVKPTDVRAIINRIAGGGRPTVANDALLYLKQMFRHGIKLDLLSYNPAEAFSVSDAGGVEKSRSRALSLDEIETVFECFDKYKEQFARENTLAVALLLTLGVRKGELIAAKWEEFDATEQLWHLPEGRSKNGKGIVIPLPSEALNWLKELHVRSNGSEFVFPKRRASSKGNGYISPDTLNAAIQKLFREDKLHVKHFTVHDLRRTCRSLLAAEGIPGHIAERCLNHSLKGVEGIYNQYDYLNERRIALTSLSKLISPIIPCAPNTFT